MRDCGDCIWFLTDVCCDCEYQSNFSELDEAMEQNAAYEELMLQDLLL